MRFTENEMKLICLIRENPELLPLALNAVEAKSAQRPAPDLAENETQR